MNEQAKSQLATRLASIANRAKTGTWPLPNSEALVFITRQEVEFGFDAATYEDFETVLSELLKRHRWSEKFSEEFLRDKLIEVVAKLIKAADTKGSGDFFGNLVTAYEAYAFEYVVFLPLGGIDLQVAEFPIGKVILRNVKRNAKQGPFGELDSISAGSGWARQCSDLKRRFFGGDTLFEVVCAEYRAVAEPRRAEERAIEECNRVLELLRFATPSLYEDFRRVEIGYLWEILERRGAIIAVQPGKQAFHSASRMSGPGSAFELNEAAIEQLRSLGFFRVGEILQKPYREVTEFEQTVLRAIHWYGTSVRQPDIENKFLNLLICVESLLSPKEKEPISNAIAEGVAFILADSLENRASHKKRMKELYAIRSGLSHGGKKEILEIDLVHLRKIASDLVVWAIGRVDEFKKHQALFDWIEVRKLT